MSRFRRNHLHVSVEADRIALVATAGLFRPRIEAEELLPVILDQEQPQACLMSLEAVLTPGRWNASTVNVVLSDQLVRYFLVDLAPGVRDAGELKQLAETRFEDIFGLSAQEWEITPDFTPFASRFLACAADRRLLAELRRLFSAANLSLTSIQPFLIREFNHWRRRIRNDLTWFAAAERESVTLALLSRNTWHGLRTHRVGSDFPRQLHTYLARDQIACGIGGNPARVWVTGSVSAQAAADSSIDIVPLDSPGWPGRSDDWCRDYRVALAGVWQ